jgi:hypothetical protein
LHGGEIIESGSHRELVDRDGRFAAMWADQISSADDARTLPDTNKDDAGQVPGYAVDTPEHENDEAHILPIPGVDTPDNMSFVPTEGGAVALGPGPVSVPAEDLPPVVPSEELAAREQALNEVRPDVSFAAVVAGEGPAKVEEAEAKAKADETAEAAPKTDDAPKTDEAPKAEVATPFTFPKSDSTPPALTFPKSDDASSLTGSARPVLPTAGSGSTPGTPGVTFAPNTDGERIKQAAQRFRKISQGAAAKSGQGLARLARRMSQGPSRQASISSTGRVVSTPGSPGFTGLSREGSVRASTDVEGGEAGSIADSENKKKKDKKDKRKSSDN